ncbi:hypothetical protein Ddye_028099 [Dipteronia dyeriana]|uniref:RRM domain-containing protein n=1 Tax=Dipteronia dyeriana TaxID=168575 RepID=A0AAD9WQU6_9ROSI|nr:hypothetical protein Ddye_028099 [Dipteronia dyeriana]
MVERVRERNSGVPRQEGINDYRENLYSIFIDNLNPKVDSACLWGIFKPHGRVMDVFLSSNSKPRRSAFSFIRFETEEEADRVAKRVDGMHVYRWAISAKLASYGWNKRRTTGLRQGTVKEDEVLPKGRLNRGSLRQDVLHQHTQQRSFSEVVKGSQFRAEEREEKEVNNTVRVKWDTNLRSD